MITGAKVLLVEDDEPSREMMVRQLERAGFKVETATTVAQARRAMDENIHLVITDLVLPDGQGWEMAREWRTNPNLSSTPIIALSALVPPADASVLCMFCDAYHQKPVSFSRLMVTINRLLVQHFTPIQPVFPPTYEPAATV